MRDTVFKRALSALPIGDEVRIEGPMGSFTLHNNTARPAVLLAGGIGVAPFLSILCYAAAERLRHRPLLREPLLRRCPVHGFALEVGRDEPKISFCSNLYAHVSKLPGVERGNRVHHHRNAFDVCRQLARADLLPRWAADDGRSCPPNARGRWRGSRRCSDRGVCELLRVAGIPGADKPMLSFTQMKEFLESETGASVDELSQLPWSDTFRIARNTHTTLVVSKYLVRTAVKLD